MLFVCYICLVISPFYHILHQPLKKNLCREHITLLIQYLCTDQILLIFLVVSKNAFLNSLVRFRSLVKEESTYLLLIIIIIITYYQPTNYYYTPSWSYDHTWNIQEVVFCAVCFFTAVVIRSSLEVLLEEASPAFVLGACSHGLSLMVTDLSLTFSETMSEQTVGWPGPTMGRRSFTWCGIPSTVMFCAL